MKRTFALMALLALFGLQHRVFSPTGTEMGDPVAIASIPLTSPSVVPMAIHLTVSSPKCWETSTTSSPPSLVGMRIASLISGSLPSSKRTSSTAPMTWVILPLFSPAISTSFLPTMRAFHNQLTFCTVFLWQSLYLPET